MLLHSADGIRVEYVDFPVGENIKLERKAGYMIMYFNLKTYQHVLFYNGPQQTYLENQGVEIRGCLVQLTKEVFMNLTLGGNKALKDFVKNAFAGEAWLFQDKPLYLDIAMHSAVQQLIDYRYSDELKEMFYYAKITELLAMQADSLIRSALPKNKYIRNEYDKERIVFARDYLIQHMDLPPSLSELALITGINEFKLKRGFKEVFNNTVFGYLADARLELAKNELMLKQKSASEIAFGLGYSSIQHFSKAFRKKFGVSPTELK